MHSIWYDHTAQAHFPQLSKDIKTDIAIVGGGMAGILTASFLTEQKKRVVVLEADTIGSGQTGRSTAKVTSQHGTIYHTLTYTLNTEASMQYAEANQRAVSAYRQLIKKRKIRCGWEDVCSCLYATENETLLHTEFQAQKEAGLPVKLISKSELPFLTKGSIQLPNQGQFHPLHFLYHLADHLQIFENTRVLTADKNQLHTTGGTVQAEQIIFTCHFPFINWPGGYFLRMHQERSYVIALTGTSKLSHHYYAVDHGGLSLRQAGNILLIGGGAHRTGENQSGGQYEALRRCAHLIFPNAEETAHWSAQDCITLDHVPYIGQFSAATPQWYVATGFGKWGMSSSMVAAELLRDLILGRPPAWDKIFSPQRFSLKSSAPSLFCTGKSRSTNASSRTWRYCGMGRRKGWNL